MERHVCVERRGHTCMLQVCTPGVATLKKYNAKRNTGVPVEKIKFQIHDNACDRMRSV